MTCRDSSGELLFHSVVGELDSERNDYLRREDDEPLALKERAIARTAPQDTPPGRYQPPDAVLAFLDSL